METQINKSPHPLMWIAGIAVILFSAAGIAAIMGWIPASMSHPNDSAALTNLEKPQANVGKHTGTKAHSASQSHSERMQVANNRSAQLRCAECGVIESTREITTNGEGTGLGAVGGAVVGGVLGNQVGGGRGRDIATVVGAVGGVVAGNEIEKRVNSTRGFEVTVRMDDGSSRFIQVANAPTWRTGDHVKVIDGAIRSN